MPSESASLVLANIVNFHTSPRQSAGNAVSLLLPHKKQNNPEFYAKSGLDELASQLVRA
jgi:hypothetical protein